MKILRYIMAFMLIFALVCGFLGVWFLYDLGITYTDSYIMIAVAFLVFVLEVILEKVFIKGKKSL